MSRKVLSILGIFIMASILLVSCAQNTVKLDPKSMLDPLKTGDKPDFQISTGVSESNNPFIKHEKSANKLAKYAPVYKDPFFNDQGMPAFGGEGPNDSYTKVSADSFHNAPVAQVYTWLVDHLSDAGLKLATKAQIGGNEDPLVYIEAEGTAYIKAIADDILFNIGVFGLRAYKGWVKVTYNGTRKIPYTKN